MGVNAKGNRMGYGGSNLLRICAALVVAAFAGDAGSDTLVLKSGVTFSGDIRDRGGDSIYLLMDGGRMSFGRDEIREIVRDNRTLELDKIVMLDVPPAAEPIPELTEHQRGLYLEQMFRLAELGDTGEDFGVTAERKKIISNLTKLGKVIAPLLEASIGEGGEGSRYLLMALAEVAPQKAATVASTIAVEHEDSEFRTLAVETVARIDAEQYSEILAGASKDSQGDVREAAITGLAAIEGGTFDSLFEEALNDPVPGVRQAAMRALAGVKDDVTS